MARVLGLWNWRRNFSNPTFICTTPIPGESDSASPSIHAYDVLLAQTRELIEACPCENGCPSCVGPAGEKSERAKEVALVILAQLCPSEPSTGPDQK